ncbi:uncharacterized protein [Dermacentor andersoni]|uniref:uncharacterized protein n=1 Tax=Dermacentor andersoni TaxID=34620 RepID=UPI0024179505|nr:uncharacterized protein LOC126533807 isoform X1 [Dermacentor andersoni]
MKLTDVGRQRLFPLVNSLFKTSRQRQHPHVTSLHSPFKTNTPRMTRPPLTKIAPPIETLASLSEALHPCFQTLYHRCDRSVYNTKDERLLYQRHQGPHLKILKTGCAFALAFKFNQATSLCVSTTAGIFAKAYRPLPASMLATETAPLRQYAMFVFPLLLLLCSAFDASEVADPFEGCFEKPPQEQKPGDCVLAPESLLSTKPYREYAHLALESATIQPDDGNQNTLLNLTRAAAQLTDGIVYRVQFTTIESACNSSVAYTQEQCTPIGSEANGLCQARFLYNGTLTLDHAMCTPLMKE